MIWQSADYQNYVGYGLTTLAFLVLFAKIVASAYRQMTISYFSAKLTYTATLAEKIQQIDPYSQDISSTMAQRQEESIR